MANPNATQSGSDNAKKALKGKKTASSKAVHKHVLLAALEEGGADRNAADTGAPSGLSGAIDEGGAGGGGGGSGLLILGGLAVAGGVAVVALGGGEKNVAPTLASTQSVSGTEDTPSTVTVAAADSNKGDTLSYTVSTPANGAASISGNVVTYTPKANFSGADSFTVTVKDAAGLSASQTVTVNVAAVNDAPTYSASSQAVSASEDAAKVIAVAATDVEGDALTYTAGAASNGTVTVSGSTATYTPNANFNGTDSFVVTVSDGKGGTATQTINVTVAAVNDAPTYSASSQAVSASEDAAKVIAVAATDVEGDALTYTAGAASNGTVTVSGSTATYTPNANFNGTDSFVVTVSDGKGGTATQTINVTVAAVNDAPAYAAASQAVSTDEDMSKSVSLAATDVEGDALTYTAGAASNGTVTVSGSTATYTPNANFNGTDSFVVTVSDGKGGTATQTINVTVAAVNDAPVIASTTPTNYTVDEDGSVEISSLSLDVSDVDTPDTLLSVGLISSAGLMNGKIVSDSGKLYYQPNPNFYGSDSFDVGVVDEGGLLARVTIPVTVVAKGEVQTIDADNDAVATVYNAAGSGLTAGDAFKFTDDSSKKTNAEIVNFSAGDVIEVTGASSDYSFTSVGSDLVITYNNTIAGVVNKIVVKGVAGAGFVSDEVSAEAILGWDFFSALTKPQGSGSGDGVAGVNGNLDDDDDANVLTTTLVSAVSGNIAFTEDATVANTVRIASFGSGDTITVSNASDGDYSFSSIGNDIVISANKNGVVSSIVLANANPSGSFISTEVSAESAIGFDFFRLASSGPATSQSIDNGSSKSVFDASAAVIDFVDDASKETNVVITGFGANDKITVVGASVGSYNFGTGLDPNDLEITFNNTSAAVTNVIVLDNVLTGKDAFIFDYATAQEALGFNFMNFG